MLFLCGLCCCCCCCWNNRDRNELSMNDWWENNDGITTTTLWNFSNKRTWNAMRSESLWQRHASQARMWWWTMIASEFSLSSIDTSIQDLDWADGLVAHRSLVVAYDLTVLTCSEPESSQRSLIPSSWSCWPAGTASSIRRSNLRPVRQGNSWLD